MVLHELCSGVERIFLDGKNTLPSLQLLEDQPQGRARRFPPKADTETDARVKILLSIPFEVGLVIIISLHKS